METLPQRVLLVDDDEAVRESVYGLLERNGYEVLIAGSGPDALLMFRRSIRRIGLLITDCEMPRMSGLELARECARIDAAVRVLYISGSRPGRELQADLHAPMRDFLGKPFRGGELVRKVRELLLIEPAKQLLGA